MPRNVLTSWSSFPRLYLFFNRRQLSLSFEEETLFAHTFTSIVERFVLIDNRTPDEQPSKTQFLYSDE